MPTNPGLPRDGDGDGRVNDGAHHEAPAPKPPVKLRDLGDSAAIREAIRGNTLAAAKAIGPVANQRHTLTLEEPHWADDRDFTLAEQKRASLEGRTLSNRLRGTWVLKDNATGQELGRRLATVANVPYMTPKGTFVLGGSDWTLAHQMRLRPGVYTRVKDSGDIESHINVQGRGAHRIFMEPETGKFRLETGQAKLPLVPLLKAMGAKDSDLREAWGQDLAHSNARDNDSQVITKLHQRLVRNPEQTPPGGQAQAVADAFTAMKLDPLVTRRTLGHPFENVSKEQILATTKKLIAVNKGEAEEDDRDHLAYMTVHGPEDVISERISKDKMALRKVLWKVSRTGSLDSIPTGVMTKSVNAAIQSSGLGQPGEEVNPAQVYEQQNRVTRMGQGAITSLDSVPDSSRNVHPSQLGYVDFVWTPESSAVGVDSRIARNVKKGSDGQLYAKFVNNRTGKEEWLTPNDVADKSVAFPEKPQPFGTPPDPYVKAIANGKLAHVARDKVDYRLEHMEDAFSPIANMVPMKSAIKPQRMSMGGRFLTQALPLVDPESPHVQSGIPGSDNDSYENLYGAQLGAVRAKHDGVVAHVSGDEVHVKGPDGKTTKHQIYNHRASNRKTGIHQTPVVKAGDRVTGNQLLARSNTTDEYGVAALGKNTRVAYVPYKGSVAAWTHVLWYRDGQPRFTPVSEVVPVAGIEALATDPVELTTVVTKVEGFIAHDAGNLLDIKTSSGRRVAATAVHSFVELGDDGSLREIAGSELRAGVSWLPRLGAVELPVTVTEISATSERLKNPLVVQLDEDFGFVCGLYAAEGCPQGSRAVWAATDQVVRDTLVAKLSRIVPHVAAGTNQPNYVTIGDARLATWLRIACGKYAQYKKVPDVAFGAPVAFRRGFLAGFWVGDGRVHAKNGVPTDTDTIITSRRLRDGLGLLMASLGISTTHSQYDDKAYTEGKAYRLGVCTRDTHKIPELPHTVKGERLKSIVAEYRDTGVADHVPLFADVRIAYRQCVEGRGFDKRVTSRVKAQAVRGTASRRDILRFVPEGTNDPSLRRLRHLAQSTLEWDRVEAIEPLPHSGWVYDFNMAPLHTFTCVDTLVVHNSNYEDAVVTSASYARRMTSEHYYQHELEHGEGVKPGKASHLAVFPGTHPKSVADTLDDDGVVRPGTVVSHGHPLALAVKRRDPDHSTLHKGRKAVWDDHSVTWDHHTDGEVVDSAKTSKGTVVTVRTHAPLRVGDKLAGRHGDKGTIARIIPDDEMPHDDHGRPYELLLNPLSIISRTNPAQKHELALGKIAAATGKKYRVQDFKHVDDLTEFVRGELAKHGMKDTETVIDPRTGRKLKNPFTGGDPDAGSRYILKLHHTAEAKSQGRGTGGYTNEGTPSKGGAEGSKRISLMDLNALLSHGAHGVIRDAGVVRGQANADYWQQFMSGHNPPTPTVPETYHKFHDLLRAAAINPVREGTRTHLMAMTDRDVDVLAGDRNLRHAETVDWKGGMRPVKGGLFDPGLTGSHGGRKWSALPLHEPFPSPVMEDPIRHVLGLTGNQFRDVLAGREKLKGETGPAAIKNALSSINLDAAIESSRQGVASGRKGLRDESVRRLKYLTSAKRLGLHPRDWVLSRMPVLPPAFRPVSVMQGSGLPMVADANALYKELHDANQNLREMHGKVEDLSDERLAVYDALKGVTGLGDPVHPKNVERNVKGVLKHVFGTSPKHGCYDDATDILTRHRGWLPFSSLAEDDEVATLNPADGSFEWQTPSEIHRYRYRGELFQFTTDRGINSVVTPNHRNWVRYGRGDMESGWRIEPAYVTAANSGRRWFRVAASGWKGHKKRPRFLPRSCRLVDFAAFVGWWAAEGWLGDRKRDTAQLCQAVHQEEKCREIARVVTALGLPFSCGRYEKSSSKGKTTVWQWSIRSAELADWLTKNVGCLAAGKKLSAKVRDWNTPYLKAFFLGYLGGDGTRRYYPRSNKGGVTHKNHSDLIDGFNNSHTVSERLAGDLQEVTCKLGVTARLYWRPPQELGDQPICRVGLNGSRFVTTEGGKICEVVDYDGYVHCVTVPNGIVYVRRNGKPMFSGNSVQRKLLSTTVDLVGRAVISPDPDLDMDSVGLPERHAWSVYKPFLVRNLVRAGLPRVRAAREVADQTPLARKVLLEELAARPVAISRAPTLHRYSIMASWPKLVSDDTMHLSPMITKGFGADFDGNCCVYDTEICIELRPTILYRDDPIAFRDWGVLFMRLTGEELVTVSDESKTFTCKIGEFPRSGKPAKDRNGADVYKVPSGVSVLSYDHERGTSGYFPVTHFTAEASHACTKVVTARKREVEVSDNESLCVFDHVTGDLAKVTPSKAFGKLVPVIVAEEPPGDEFDRDLGWWYGSLASDGWVTAAGVGYAKCEDKKRAEFVRIAAEQLTPEFALHEYREEAGKDKYAASVKVHLNGVKLSRLVFNCYDEDGPDGRSSLRKIIPRRILDGGSRECLLGVLSGLLDGDGTLAWHAADERRNKPQFLCSYSTSSPSLARDVRRLCRRLGVRTGITTSPATKSRNEAYVVTISTVDLYKIAAKLTPVGKNETDKLSEFLAGPPVSKDDLDIVPVTKSLCTLLAKGAYPGEMTLYSAARKAIVDGSLGRSTAIRLLELLPDDANHPHLDRFIDVVNNTRVHWDRVKTVTPSGNHPVFDLAVPATKVFAIDNGLVIFDTMNFHAFGSDEAARDAVDKMLPSRNLLAVSDFKAHQVPSQEYVAGLYAASAARNDSKRPRTFATTRDVVRAYNRGELGEEDPVHVADHR